MQNEDNMNINSEFGYSDDITGLYLEKLQQRNINAARMRVNARKDVPTMADVPNAEDENTLIEVPDILIKNPVEKETMTETTIEDQNDLSMLEQGWNMLPEGGQKLVWPLIAPFVVGAKEENPIVRGMTTGVLQDAPQGILNLGRDITNALGGDFKEEDWLQIPNILKSNPDSNTEQIVRGVSQFFSVFGAVGGLSKGANYFTQMARGGFADSTFDIEAGNLATVLRQLDVDNEFTQFMDSKVGEDADALTRLKARAKNVLEGAGITGLVDGFIRGIKYVKDNPQVRANMTKFLDNIDGMAKPTVATTAGVTSANAESTPKQVRNVRNNNPGNIKDFGDKWEGMIGTDSGGNVAEGSFVKFESPELGVRALTKDITNKRRRGLNTVEKILKVYAPEGRENNLQAYIDDVTSDLGIKPNTKLRDKNMFALIKAITKHEGGKDSLSHFTDDVIMSGMSMAYPKRYRKG